VTALTHVAVGAALGSFVGGRGASFAVGLASHVPLDVIPHYELEKMWVEVASVAAALVLLVFLGHGTTTVFFGALGGLVPDVENLLWRRGIIPGRWKLFPGHAPWLSRIVPHGKALPARHAWWQAAIIVVASLVAFRGLARGVGWGSGVGP
jgi:hypothetical protein